MSRIFLSHSSKDNFEAIALRDWLASEGWNDVFLDLDPERGIAAGQRWEQALNAAASRCDAVIFLVSKNWLASGWCMKEYYLARGLNKKLFAALIDPTKTIDSLPDQLKGVWQALNLVGGQDHRQFPARLPDSHEERHIAYSQSGLLRLKRGLEKAGLDPKFFAWPPEHEPDRAPYRGLKPQEEDDAGVFFGRDAPIVEAIDRLRGLRKGAPPRLMVILGASGSGKSSFLRAGVLPRLRRDDVQFIPLPVVRPERAALSGENGFINALAVVLRAHPRAKLRAAVQNGASALRPLLADLAKAAVTERTASDETERPPAFVIAIDQTEELFRTEGREESDALLTILADLAKGDEPTVIVIFTIRSDSYDALQSAKALEGLRQVAFSLLAMPRGAYKDVIEGPARRMEEAGRKLTVEPSLTQKLLVDVEVGAGDALPLLAFTLEQLYLDYRQTGALQLKDYEESDGLKGAINAAVERAFVRGDADARIPRDREARLALLRRGLIPWLAGVDPNSRTYRRNIALHSDIPPEAAPLIDLLAEERLLSRDIRVTRDPKIGTETRESTIEPTHEALLRQWDLLNGWLGEDFARLATLEGVKHAARDWNANARGRSWIAHLGERLDEAQALHARPDIAAKLDKIDLDYLADCANSERAARRQRRFVFGSITALVFAVIGGLTFRLNEDRVRAEWNWIFTMKPYMEKHFRPFVLTAKAEGELKAGQTFRECDKDCPTLTVVPPGSFMMGSDLDDKDRYINEELHGAYIGYRFAVSINNVTVADWNACVRTHGCPFRIYSDFHATQRQQSLRKPFDPSREVVVNLNWNDAQTYVAWLFDMTGKHYRLLSETEWEYAARAGASTAYYWGSKFEKGYANCAGCGSEWDNTTTSPAGSFAPNLFGLYDMAGNVWQWVEDCVNGGGDGDYKKTPVDGRAWVYAECPRHYLRGGSYTRPPRNIRVTARLPTSTDEQSIYVGFRVVRDLDQPSHAGSTDQQ
jgi:formylglycine-generating enzyme required for sulfatase activity